MAKCPTCNGCMVVRGSYFIKGKGVTHALVKWYCRFCKKYFIRRTRGHELEEVS